MLLMRNCTLLHYYAMSGDNFLPTFRDNLWVPSLGGQEFLLEVSGQLIIPDSLSQNVSKKLPLFTV